MPSQEAIEEFKELYLQEYGIQLSTEQAIYLGTKLIRYVRAVYGDDLPCLDSLTNLDKKE